MSRRTGYRDHQGLAPKLPPAQAGIWSRSAVGNGTQALVWPIQSGRWTVVAMNADRSPGVRVRADVGATAPSLGAIAGGLLAGGSLLPLGGVVLIALPVRRAATRTTSTTNAQDQQGGLS